MTTHGLVRRSSRAFVRNSLALVAAPLLVVGVACAVPSSQMSSVALPSREVGAHPKAEHVSQLPLPVGATSHVVIVSIDGLRPDAISRFNATTLKRLAREGSYTYSAQTINPSKTLPSHTSMLTGEGPEKHGITWNSNETDIHSTVAVPTVFGVAHTRGLTTAAFFSKGKFNHLEVPGSLDYSQAPNGDGKWDADRTIGDVDRYLSSHKPSLLFVHLAEPDKTGHIWGWMSGRYGNAVRKADAAVAKLLTLADRTYGAGNYTVIVTADHGGHGRTHGSTRKEDMTIPWITWGHGVNGGTTIASKVRTMDTAGTALWLLGVNAPEAWTGQAVREAFTQPAQAASDQATAAEAAAAAAAAGAQ